MTARPNAVTAAVLLLAAWWFGSLALMLSGAFSRVRSGDVGPMIAGCGFWTIVVVLLLHRLWRGGPLVRLMLRRFALLLGACTLLAAATLAAMGVGGWVAGIAAGAALLGAGVLLGRADVVAWSTRARTRSRGRSAGPR